MAKTTTILRTDMEAPFSATRRATFSMIGFLFAIVCVCLLTLLLSSCAREIENIDPQDDNPGVSIVRGKDGKLNFEISFKNYGENANEETPTVRAAVDLTPETVVIELDDTHALYATLEHAEAAITTRSSSEPAPSLRSFENNTRLHIIAYQVGGSSPGYTCHSEYVVETGGTTRALRRTGPELTLIDGNTYKFVAVSYNTNTTAMLPTTYPASLTDIDPTLDLIWGQTSAPVTIGSTNLVTIYMTHKFSKINLTVKSELGTITTLSNVWIAGYRANMMDVETGDLSNHSATNIVFPFPASPNADSSKVTSIVFTGIDPPDPTFINIGSIITAGQPYSNLSAMFAKIIESGFEYNLRMTIRDREELLTDDLPPAGFMPYVGAFWKSNQRGERLIHMPRLSTGEVDGAWKAEVIYGDWIVLDRAPSLDGYVRLVGFTPVDMMAYDAAHVLPTSATKTVIGYLRASGASGYQAGDENIYFRIGLLSPNPNPATPRYGMVLLTYAGNTLRQRIWIRQGEESDFVPGMNSGSKWSPYNMKFVASSSGSVDLSGHPPLEGGIGQHGLPAFTTYPTQAGYLYQWTNPPVAYHPVDPVSATPTGWDIGYEGPFRLGSVCPSGYVVPSGGSASDLESLVTASRVAGYYADGWFDRWNITQSVTGYALSAVSATTVDAGYAGVVFFSPGNNRSIFFPFAGYRVGINDMSGNPGEGAPAHGALLMAGQVGNYWSSTATTGPAPEDNHSAFHLNLDLSRTGPTVADRFATHIGTGTGRHMKGYAHSIRCVRVL